MWQSINETADLQHILEASAEKPQLLYKHSPQCSISFLAKEELEQLDEHVRKAIDIYLIDVISQRDISNAIVDELEIRHESPQVLIVQNGEVRWHASHWGINNERIAEVMA